MPLRLIVLIVGLLALHGSAIASAGVQPGYRNKPTVFAGDDGLPQAGVNAMVQTRDGYLWVGTFGGLARFDGVTFKVFRTQPGIDAVGLVDGAHSGPASDRILALHEDAERRLWIGTQDAGLSVLENGVFRHLSVCGGTCEIHDILHDAGGTIWIASSMGVLKLVPASGRETRIEHPGWARSGRLAVDLEGRVYAGGEDGLYVVSGDKLRSVPLPGGDGKVEVLEADDGYLLVGSERALYRFVPALGQWQPTGIEEPGHAARDAHGRWWIAQHSGQVLREDEAGDWKPVPELSELSIASLLRDDEGNMWIGSSSRGLWRLRKSVFGLMAEPQLGTQAPGRAVVADGQGGLWFGFSCGELRHWRSDGSLLAFPIRPQIGNDCVSSLLRDNRGMLWIGTNGGDLARIVGDQLERITTWSASGSIGIWQDSDGRYFISSGRSTFELDIDGDGRIAGHRPIQALEGISVNQMVPAMRGGNWFIGDYGVQRLVDNQVVEQWTLQEGLSSRFARALYEDAAGVLWVGTYGGGLNRIENGQVRRYNTGNGLFDDTVSCILADGQGRLWLGGNRGVTLLPSPQHAAATLESVGYSAANGLTPSEINGGTSSACHRDGQGRLWFSLVEGFAVVDPADVPNGGAVPLRTYIEHVVVEGKAQDLADSTLRLGSFARNLEIRYTAVNLSKPRETNFRFRLSGFDRDWVDAGQNRSILYPSIPWGEHRFEVQARVEGGPWSPVPASLRIVHPQPWYQRPWVWTMATLLGLLVLVGSTQLEKSQARNQGKRAATPGPRRS